MHQEVWGKSEKKICENCLGSFSVNSVLYQANDAMPAEIQLHNTLNLSLQRRSIFP